jgi:CheY-like chemotaxis protein
MPLVLLVEDDRSMRRYLTTTLTDQRLRVVDAQTGAEALVQASGHNPDLILLDMVLPDMDGIHVTTKLREWTVAPIVIVSAKDDETEKVAALDAGANDYLTKPFRTNELLARIRVWLRHIQRASADTLSPVLEVGDLRIDFGKRLAFAAGREIRLTPTQYKLAFRGHDAQRREGAHPRADPVQRVGSGVHEGDAIPARLHGQAAAQVRKGPRPPSLLRDRVGRGLPTARRLTIRGFRYHRVWAERARRSPLVALSRRGHRSRGRTERSLR